MVENLAYLPSVSPSAHNSRLEPIYYVYGCEGNSGNEAKALDSYLTYGVLYNYTSALSACPPGWHLQSDNEWKVLESNLGMNSTDLNASEWRNSGSVGGKLKEAGFNHWDDPNTGATNSSGFNALPSGFRLSPSGTFKDRGINGHF